MLDLVGCTWYLIVLKRSSGITNWIMGLRTVATTLMSLPVILFARRFCEHFTVMEQSIAKPMTCRCVICVANYLIFLVPKLFHRLAMRSVMYSFVSETDDCA